MIGEWRCQWSLLPVSSHPVIWINLGLIGTTALKCGETNPSLDRSIVRAVEFREQEVKPLCRHPFAATTLLGYCPLQLLIYR